MWGLPVFEVTQLKEGEVWFHLPCSDWVPFPCTHANGLRLWGYTSSAGSAVGRHQGFHMDIVGAVGHFLGDVQGQKNLIQLCLQFEIGDTELASKWEEEPSPCCLYVAQSWNGTAEMQSLKHPETRHPVMLGLVPSPKGRGSQNYNTLYNLLITAFMKQKPPESILPSAVTDALAEPLCCCSWVLGTNSPFSPWQGCAEIHKPSLCFFFPPAPNSSVL